MIDVSTFALVSSIDVVIVINGVLVVLLEVLVVEVVVVEEVVVNVEHAARILFKKILKMI